MILPITGCFTHPRSDHSKAARIADGLIACALLIIGICGTQWAFMPSYLAPALIGAGIVYSICVAISLGWCIKHKIMESREDLD